MSSASGGKKRTSPKGYRQSELGLLPSDWKVEKIGNITKVNVARDLQKGSFSKCKTKTHFYPVYSNTVEESGFYGGYYDFPEYEADAITVVGRGAGLGTAFHKDHQFGAIGRLLVLMPNSNLNAVFLSESINGYINLFVESTGIPQLTGEQIANYSIALPPLPEQQKIANILSTWDDAIEKTQSLIDHLKERNKGLAQQLLTGTKRLKGFKGKWKLEPLEVYFKERNEIGFRNLPLLSVGESGVYPQSESNKRDTSNADKSLYKRICVGDIGYNTMRMWQGRSALSELEGIVSPAYTIVTPKKNADAKFFSYVLKLEDVVHRFFRKSQGLVDDTLNCKFKDFKIVRVMVPPTLEEQKAIAKTLLRAKQEVQLLDKKLALLKEQKKGLMQNLLTGKVRVKVAQQGAKNV